MNQNLPDNGQIVGRCIGCRHDFRTGSCGGCGAVPGQHEPRCDGQDTDACALCSSVQFFAELACHDCLSYAAQDADPIAQASA